MQDIRRMLGICVVAMGLFTAAAAQDWSKVEIQAQPVSGSVHMLVGAGGNIAVSAGDDGVILVDDQYAGMAQKIEAALKGISSQPLRFVLNTHWHGDHTGSNAHFGKRAVIVAQENVRRRLVTGGETRFGKVPPVGGAALPVITFGKSVSLHINGEEVRAIHAPNAHTDGDSIIWFTKSNVVHMGDNFFNGMYPFIDLDSGGSVQGVIRTVENSMKEIPDDAKIIPGHGPLATKADLGGFLAMLKETSAMVQAAINKGEKLEAIKAKKPALGKYSSSAWSKGFLPEAVYLEIVYNSLTAAPKGANPQHPHGHDGKK